MAEELVASDRIKFWADVWKDLQIGFHHPEVNAMLVKYINKLIPQGKANKVFFPLCGKTLDMKWLYDQGFTVVGVEGVETAIIQFFAEQKIDHTVEDVQNNGKECKLFKSTDGRVRIYCADMLKCSRDLEGQFDAIWDRGSLVALERTDVPEYISVIKNVLSSNGRILLEVMEYDVAIMKDTPHPPPHPMYEEELKRLYEPDGKVEFLERTENQISGRDVHIVYYCITKLQH